MSPKKRHVAAHEVPSEIVGESSPPTDLFSEQIETWVTATRALRAAITDAPITASTNRFILQGLVPGAEEFDALMRTLAAKTKHTSDALNEYYNQNDIEWTKRHGETPLIRVAGEINGFDVWLRTARDGLTRALSHADQAHEELHNPARQAEIAAEFARKEIEAREAFDKFFPTRD